MDRARIIAEDRRTSIEYLQLVDHFIEVASEHARVENKSGMRCPCKDCNNNAYLGVRGLREHLIIRGFNHAYTCWRMHGEEYVQDNESMFEQRIVEEDMDYNERLNDMADDVARNFVQRPEVLRAMYNDKETPLYEGSTHTVLSATLLIMNLRAKHGFSDKAMTEALLLVKDLLPKPNLLPDRAYAAKKILCPMGLELEKIHACPNDCMLYRGQDDKHRDACRVCGVSRYKSKDGKIEVGAEMAKEGKKLTPAKVLWYLPIIPRLQRLFSNKVDARNLTWHSDRSRPSDDIIRHTSDGDQWKKVDMLYPEFARDPRNVRLGLSTDGMNPYGDMSTTHSSWPVMLVLYNLPSWLTMKRKYVLLSLMISGPKQPGNDIDVYLEPLIEDLLQLWYGENWTYDSHRGEWFKLKGMMFCTINDFPALGNVSGYSVKGHYACPVCEENTNFCQLHHGRKTVYLGHRRFLPKGHPMRKCKKWFNGEVEHGLPPHAITGEEVFQKVKEIENDFGKGRKKHLIPGSWKKCSIFFELPYWKDLDVRHCLDVMHIEKNVCDSLIGTLLNLPTKSKDGLKSRKDLERMGIRPELAPVVDESGKTFLPPASYTLSANEKRNYLECLKKVKVPTNYSSNISSCVDMDELKLGGLKSHDCHVLMQDLNIIAIRNSLPNHVRLPISRLCLFFKSVCRKSISRARLDELQTMIVEVLCEMEMFFPPSFFDIMVHLVVHLVREIKLCGPVFLRWMYPFERYMKIFKCFVKNRYRPDASIVSRYVAEEAIEFCHAYLEEVETIGIPSSRHDNRFEGHGVRHGKLHHPTAEELVIAHLYVLRNHEAIRPYVELHLNYIESTNRTYVRSRVHDVHVKTFSTWLRDTVETGDHPETVKWLSRRPLGTVLSYGGYDVKGYSYSTKAMDDRGISQNSGVSTFSETLHVENAGDPGGRYELDQYYGTITDIWELNYVFVKVVVFKCAWVDPSCGTRYDPLGLTLVNRAKIGYKSDPFILATEGRQVFYVQDPTDRHYEAVVDGKKTFLGEYSPDEYSLSVVESPLPITRHINLDESSTNLRRHLTRTDHNEGIWLDVKGNLRKRKFKLKGKLKTKRTIVK